MMPCQDVRNLIEEHLAGTLDSKRRRALIAHLKTCPDCHRAVEEARLAGMVLREASQLPPPPDLAVRIKSAARFRLLNRPRPLHERALGSPAFLATCASLLCGAIICLSAILRVGSVPVDPPAPQLAAQPVEVHSMVTVQRARRASVRVARQRPPAMHDVVHVERQGPSGMAMLPLAAEKTRNSLDGRTSSVAAGAARLARAERPLAVHIADHPADQAVAMVLRPAVQRTSLPEDVAYASSMKSSEPPAPALDRSEIVPATSFIFEATEPPGDQR